MIRAAVVGGSGYAGVELLRLLARHAGVRLSCVASRAEAGKPVSGAFPSLRGVVNLNFEAPEPARLAEADVVFFATPHGVAMNHAPALLKAGVRVIDLAADFRLRDPAEFQQWYGMPHACPELLPEAVYALPEIARESLRGARLAAMPGCYPTTVQLGLLPLLEMARRGPGAIDLEMIVADCKSGISGAGRKAELGLLLAEAADNFKPYGLSGHRHHPEIVQELGRVAGSPVGLTFVPHLLPTIRGMLSTIYVRLDAARGLAQEEFQAAFERRYAGERFVDVMPAGSAPEIRSVRGANCARIALHRPSAGLLTVFVVIDNLVKGAAGQAVQAMNLMFGLDESEGLEVVPLSP